MNWSPRRRLDRVALRHKADARPGQVVESGPPGQIFEAAETDRLQRFLCEVL
jgi:ABC-type histidine transport system ATPase subunit